MEHDVKFRFLSGGIIVSHVLLRWTCFRAWTFEPGLRNVLVRLYAQAPVFCGKTYLFFSNH